MYTDDYSFRLFYSWSRPPAISEPKHKPLLGLTWDDEILL